MSKRGYFLLLFAIVLIKIDVAFCFDAGNNTASPRQQIRANTPQEQKKIEVTAEQRQFIRPQNTNPVTQQQTPQFQQHPQRHLYQSQMQQGGMVSPQTAKDVIPVKQEQQEQQEQKQMVIDNKRTIEKEIYPSSQIIGAEEVQSAIHISLKDVSRLVCDKNIQRIVFSKEKGVEAKVEGRNVFVKNLPVEKVTAEGGLMYEYDATPKELFVVCGDKVFTLIMFPKDIPSVTVYLQTKDKDKSKVIEHERSLPYESQILGLIKSIYDEIVPVGYEPMDINKKIKEFIEFSIYHKKSFYGGLYDGHEFVIISNKRNVRIDEASFLQVSPLENVLAVALTKHVVNENDTSRVFVITRSVVNE